MSDSDILLETARALHRSASSLSRRLLAARAPEGLSVSKLAVLGRLQEEGPRTATSLAAYLRIQPQSLTRLLAELERRGLIARQTDDADRRQSWIAITPQGAVALGGDVRARRQALARAMAATLTPAELGLLRLATGLMDRLSAAIAAED